MRKRNGSFDSDNNDSNESSGNGPPKTFCIDEDEVTQMRMDNIRTVGKSASFNFDDED